MPDSINADFIRSADLRHHFHPMTNPTLFAANGPSFVERAKGIYLTIAGEQYIDAMSGMACSNVGYGNDRICNAAFAAMREISYAHSFVGQSNHASSLLAAKLAQLTEHKFSKFFFASSGSEANESAVKIAYYYWALRGKPEKRILISRKHAYHGNTIVATSLTGIDHYHHQFDLPLAGLVRYADAPYWYRYGRGQTPEEQGQVAAASLEATIREVGPQNVAAFFAEPVQGAGGMIVPPKGYFTAVEEICRRYDILFICDEVITGFGKLGSMFGHQELDFNPDMITCGKGLTSSYFPMSAVGISSSIVDVLDQADVEFVHGFTNCAHPVGAAVALENIAVIEDEGLVPYVKNTLGPALAEGLDQYRAHPLVGDVRVKGVMAAIEFKGHDGSFANACLLGSSVVAAARQNKLIVRPNGPSLVMTLPMITSLVELDQVLEVIGLAIRSVSP